VVTLELVVVGFIEPCAPIFIEKTEYDYRMRAVIWRRQNLGVGIYVDIKFRHIILYHLLCPSD